MFHRYVLNVATLLFLCVVYVKNNCAEKHVPNAIVRPINTPTWNKATYYERLRNTPGVKVVSVEKTADRFGHSFVAAVTEQLGIFGKAPQDLPVSSADDLLACDLLDYYDLVTTPLINDLVIYTDDDLAVQQSGLVTAISGDDIYKTVVKLKFNEKLEIVNDFLFGFVHENHTNAFFYRMKDVFKNDKKRMLHSLQTAIRESKTIQNNIAKVETLFFQLADGKNVTDDQLLPEGISSFPAKIIHLLKNCMGLNIDVRNQFGQTALMLAVRRGMCGVVDVLLSMNADPNLQDQYGNTALHLATQHSKNGEASLLLQYKIDPYVKNRRGESAVNCEQAAELSKKWNEALLFLAVDSDELTEDAKGRIKYVLKNRGRRINLDMKVKEGMTLLMWTAIYNNLDVAKLLIEKGADRTITDDSNDLTALDYARVKGNPEMIKLLS